jgi:hypothetical protein
MSIIIYTEAWAYIERREQCIIVIKKRVWLSSSSSYCPWGDFSPGQGLRVELEFFLSQQQQQQHPDLLVGRV